MALMLSLRGFDPSYGKNCYFSENSSIIGDVVMGDDCTVWFNAVIRGDVNSIRIGNKVNIQDGAILHTTYKKSIITIGDNVSIGHNVIIHGATIHSNVLVGMGAIIMDHAVIGENSIIWSTEGLPSGIYFAKLKLNNSSDNAILKLVLGSNE